jgi:hypothetical protein
LIGHQLPFALVLIPCFFFHLSFLLSSRWVIVHCSNGSNVLRTKPAAGKAPQARQAVRSSWERFDEHDHHCPAVARRSSTSISASLTDRSAHTSRSQRHLPISLSLSPSPISPSYLALIFLDLPSRFLLLPPSSPPTSSSSLPRFPKPCEL